jgi:hypothetical protein
MRRCIRAVCNWIPLHVCSTLRIVSVTSLGLGSMAVDIQYNNAAFSRLYFLVALVDVVLVVIIALSSALLYVVVMYVGEKSVYKLMTDPPMLPKLRATLSASESAVNRNHQPVITDVYPIGKIRIAYAFRLRFDESRVLGRLRDGSGAHHNSTEAEVSGFVEDAVLDVLAALRLPFVSTRKEIELSSIRCDIWFIYANGHPIGVMQIKKPPKGNEVSPVNDPQVFGQLYDYLGLIRSFYGLRKVFGIVSTYNEWKFGWLPDCRDAACTTGKALVSTRTSENALDERRMDVSRVYELHDPELFSTLATVMTRMHAYAGDGIPVWSPRRSVLSLRACQDALWQWTKIPSTIQLSLTMPHSSTRNFMILGRCGAGSEGSCFLAASSSGCLCAVKLYGSSQFGLFEKCKDRKATPQLDPDSEHIVREENITKASIERDMWHRCGFKGVFSVHEKGRFMLVMPVAFTCHEVDGTRKFNTSLLHCRDSQGNECPIPGWQEIVRYVCALTPDLVIDKCIRHVANAKIINRDVEWRHVALVPEKQQAGGYSLVPILLDFGLAEEAETVEVAYDVMTNLRNAMQ